MLLAVQEEVELIKEKIEDNNISRNVKVTALSF